jgi:hypothetical protein
MAMDDTEHGAPASNAPRLLSPQPPARLYRPLMVLAACAETALFFWAASGRIPLSIVLGLHLAIVAALAATLNQSLRSGRDGGFALMGVIGTLATGPFGALCAAMLPALSATQDSSAARLAAWYERIALSSKQDAFTQMSDRIAIGRAANLAAPTPIELMGEFQGGSTAIQQTALGVIARNFHPDYLPVLKIALDSPEPVVRVQAAAVAARVRETLKREIGAMIARAADPTLKPDAALRLAVELEMTANSGLLEAAAHAEAVRTSAALRARLFARLDTDQHRTGGNRPLLTAEAVAEAYLSRLLKDGRFADFRRARTRMHVPYAGRYRHRRIVVTPRTNGGHKRFTQKTARAFRPGAAA